MYRKNSIVEVSDLDIQVDLKLFIIEDIVYIYFEVICN